MDNNANENQMEELEPISSDPQPAPEPEEAAPAEELILEDEPAAAEVEEVVETQEDESEGSQVEEPVEILEDLPVIEEAEEIEEVAEAIEVEDTVDQSASEEDLDLDAATADVEDAEADVDADAEELEIAAPVIDLDRYQLPVEEDEEEEEPSITYHEPDVNDGRAWYVIHCYSGNEDKVRHNIMQRIESMSMDDLIFDVVVPTEDEVNIKNGERQTVEKKVFPGYILVYMVLTEESWYMVRNTPGVTGFVGMGNDPTPLQPEEVARILKRMESESPRINVTFRPGERVRIVDGPFEDFYGKVSEIDMERATVRVMVNFFGRETPVELDFLQVEEA